MQIPFVIQKYNFKDCCCKLVGNQYIIYYAFVKLQQLGFAQPWAFLDATNRRLAASFWMECLQELPW